MLRSVRLPPRPDCAGAPTPAFAGCRPFPRLVLAALAFALLAGAGIAPGALAHEPSPDFHRTREQAEQLRRSQRLHEALVAYRALVAQEPESFEDRFWVAKLESWTGDLAAADRGFVRLLAERPGDYDSRIALADVRLWRGDTAATRELLDGLRQDYADDPEVRRRIDALGRGSPANRWVADLGYFGERLPGGATATGGLLSLAARHGDRFRWRASATLQEKFDRTESRAGGEVGLGLIPRLDLVASVFVAPGAEVLPRGSYGLSAGRRVGRAVVLYAQYAYHDYRDADVHQAGPAAEVYFGRWLLAGRVHWAATRFPDSPMVHDGAGSLTVGYSYGSGDDLLRVFAAAGAESYTQPSRELIGRFHARTVGLSWRHYLTGALGLEALWAHQDRRGSGTATSWGVRVLHRW